MNRNISSDQSGKVTFVAPSNIAFIKYWGKQPHQRQIPMNPSISMTLDKCFTETTLEFQPRVNPDKCITSFTFDDRENDLFKIRIENYLESIEDQLPYLVNYEFKINTRNSFPHSAGIASSASAFAAIALCLEKINSKLNGITFSLERASELARLGSGSACRSIYSGFVAWGQSSLELTSDQYAVSLENIHPCFEQLHDSILIVNDAEKEISSSVGHSLMNAHPFKEARYLQAKDNYHDLYHAMIKGDFKIFGEILELEALTLHGLMMSSSPSFILLKANSISIIEKVRKFRETTHSNLYFTIDAGPNIHLIYPNNEKELVQDFMAKELTEFCIDGKIIHDKMGNGPVDIADVRINE